MADLSKQPERVFVTDDHGPTMQQIATLLAVENIPMEASASLLVLLDRLDYDRLTDNTLIVAEINLPELGGLDLLNILNADNVCLPTVLMGSELSVSDAVDAMHAGANYILKKPFSDAAFHKAMKRALHAGCRQSGSTIIARPAKRRLSSLSPRQRELLMHVFEGRTNKEIAGRLAISQKTVELHRAAMMQKMGATSLAELIRIAVQCGEPLLPGPQHECA